VAGTSLYQGLLDRLFGAPGSWGIRRCDACSLLWIDPAPLPSELSKAYRSYYTHAGEEGSGSAGCWIRRRIDGLYGHLVHYSGLLRARRRLLRRPLDRMPPGVALEIGCGDGSFLVQLQAAGWEVTGVDSDPLAAQAALDKHGITVQVGFFEECRFPEESFDLIVMNHVIEHVVDPVALLSRCAHLLREGGALLMVTPNGAGVGHALFGSSWRGLEPPRHLQIFSPRALASALARGGLEAVSLRTTSVNAEAFFWGSIAVREGKDSHRSLSLTLLSWLYQYYALVRTLWDRDAGEEIVAVCSKIALPAEKESLP